MNFLKYLPGRVIWRMPFRFNVANAINPSYTLRCVLYHDISDTTSTYTNGLGVTVSKKSFENDLRFLAKHYTPVTLDEALNPPKDPKKNYRPVLLTFDDAYASVATEAAPICQKYGIPAVFFVSARFIGNQDLAMDNLICHVANTRGYDAINKAASEAAKSPAKLNDLSEACGDFLPRVWGEQRETFRQGLADAAGRSLKEMAEEAGLYISPQQLRSLASFNFEIGNHTYSHVYGRNLAGNDFAEEIGRNKSVLESISGKTIRTFSAPYGSAIDLPGRLVEYLRQLKHESAFLVESSINNPRTDPFRLLRVSVQVSNNADLFSELEIMPRLRSIRDALFRRQGNVTPAASQARVAAD
ncbi:MAG: polysaccharide deacetylase family protein [Acidobacteriia bacterium]|nr:polysaccharide deacetylase family protein [Terriglobia bacterium]